MKHLKIMSSKQDLVLNWLKNMVWDRMTLWEQEFVDSMWVRDKFFFPRQSIKLEEIYEKYRRPKEHYASTKVSPSEYEYIHNFDR